MITFYHSPNSRSTTVATAIEEMGVGDRHHDQNRHYSTPRRLWRPRSGQSASRRQGADPGS